MTAKTILKLGDFVFSGQEIPPKISFGGDQALAIHELIGGVRVVDAMGRQDAPLEWSGILRGENALSRARYLDGLRIAGKELKLGWSELSYLVLVKTFRCDFERSYFQPYSISCVVVADLSSPVSSIANPGVDEWIGQDMASAMTLGGLIGDGPLSGLLGALGSAIGAVSSFATAAQSTLNSVLGPLAAVQARVGLLVSSVGSTISNVSSLGGIVPNSPITQMASKLTSQVSAMTQLPQLYNLQSVLGRIGGNIGSIGGSGNKVATAGGNLYQMASSAYGDAMAWPTIASANKLTDPSISGLKSIVVPAQSGDSGGVLNA
jgi:hypothetical protein